jgi:hypothetical protein
MSFDLQPPRWWGLALIAGAVVLLGLGILLGPLTYGAWRLYGPLLVLTARQELAHLTDMVGPFR